MDTSTRPTVGASGAAGPGTPLPGPVVGAPRRAHRAVDEAMIGGIAAGLAEHLGLPVLWVRIGFLVSLALGGFGALVYAGLWFVLPAEQTTGPLPPGLEAATRQGRRTVARERRLLDYGPLVAVGAIAVGLLLLLADLTGTTLAVGPLLLAVAGVAVLWRQADEAQRQRWRDSSSAVNPVRALVGDGGWAAYARIVLGLLLVVAAIVLFSLRTGSVSVALNAGLAAALAMVGVAFVAGPWLLRLVADLGQEREARIRSEERADVAAHLHDSVLQTLALIQRSSADPATVSRLARAQERDLRAWLFEDPSDGATTVAAALRAAAAAVEDDHAHHGNQEVTVDVVCVGDAELDDDLQPLVLAAREAMANAARHSGAATVDVYAESTQAAVEVFVRDRGRGFDQETVASDRQGIRSSIIGRMQRHGGSAEVRTTPGSGTEVRLRMPRRVGEPRPTTSEESS